MTITEKSLKLCQPEVADKWKYGISLEKPKNECVALNDQSCQ